MITPSLNSNQSWIEAPPRAAPMLEALRGLGYSIPAAIADIVDNSITAGAKHIALTLDWNGPQSTIVVADDGCGMSRATLENAMRLGFRDPREERHDQDLGRFGLGLKTASFALGRRLTVLSREECGDTSAYYWDLDLAMTAVGHGWNLMRGVPEGLQQIADFLPSKSSGTVVVIDRLDRIFNDQNGVEDVLEMVDKVENHLGMVYHRFLANQEEDIWNASQDKSVEGYLSDPSPTHQAHRESIGSPMILSPRLVITINGVSVRPWDPFFSHAATWYSPEERISTRVGTVGLQSYVLPPRSALTDIEYAAAEGPEGWAKQQGFYVYRNSRLLVAGSWLGLQRGRHWLRDEASRLARIRVDIPNSADADWRIDVRKSVARPPSYLRERLISIAEDTRARARAVFANRPPMRHGGRRTPIADGRIEVWRTVQDDQGARHEINLDHPFVRLVMSEAGFDMSQKIRQLLRLVAATVPIQRLWMDHEIDERNLNNAAPVAETPEFVKKSALYMFLDLVTNQNVDVADARRQLLLVEPFGRYAHYIAALTSETDNM